MVMYTFRIHYPCFPSFATRRAHIRVYPCGHRGMRSCKADFVSFQYITKTLHLALPSLAINGLDASPNILSRPIISSENFEPYDPRLASKIRNLYVNLEAETTRVAQLRREAPAVAAKAYTERLEREIGEDHAGLEDGMIKIGNAQREGLLGGNHGEIERAGDVRRAWQEALEGLVQFRDVTEQVAKLDRAKDVVAVVQGR